MVLLAVPLVRLHIERPELRRLTFVDLGFLCLGVATLLTLVLAPVLVEGVGRSFRDLFEVVRILEYWMVFRLGLTLGEKEEGGSVARVLSAAAVALGAFAVVQYLDPLGVNELVTSVWTEGHNLAGTVQDGRAVGTAGNANQFGMLAVLLLVTALARRITLRSGRWVSTAAIAVFAATLGLFLSQSRGALLGAALGLVVAACLLAIRRETRAAIRASAPPMLAGLAVFALLVSLAPPSGGSIAGRFDVMSMLRDPSVLIRLGTLEAILAADAPPPGGGPGGTGCVQSMRPPTTPRAGHEPGTNPPPRADDGGVVTIAGAVGLFYCDRGRWPTDLTRGLEGYLNDDAPADLGRYELYTSERGFVVGQRKAGPDRVDRGGAGTLPNLLANASFEDGATPPSRWLVTPGTTTTPLTGESAFGTSVADTALAAGGALYQLVVADLPMGTEFTAGIWANGPGDEPTELQIYIVAITADGLREDPLAQESFMLSAGGDWEHIGLTFRTPMKHLTTLQVMFRSPEGSARVLLDGATLTEGPVLVPFGRLEDRPASAGDAGGPSFRDSPIIGLGPQKDAALSTLDNEYLLFLTRYGIVGLGAYLLLFFSAFVAGTRSALRRRGWPGLLGVAVAASTVALGAFAISAGAYGQLQVMIPFWLLVGLTSTIAAVGTTSDAGTAALRGGTVG